MNPNILWPCITSFVGIGVYLLGVVTKKAFSASMRWPKTNGVIRESSVESGWAQSGGSRNFHVVKPKVVYEYEVEGEKYSSTQLALAEVDTADREAAQRKADDYPAGKQVDVYYNPKEPWKAVLVPDDPSGGVLPLGLMAAGALAALAGVVWFCAGRR